MKPKLLLALLSIFLVFSCSKKDLPDPKPDPKPDPSQLIEIKVIGGAIKDAELIDSNDKKANYKGNGVYAFDGTPTGTLTLSGGKFEESDVENRLTYTVDAKYKIISPITHFVTKHPNKKEALLNALNIDENDLSIDFIQNLADNKDTEKAVNLAKASQMLYALGSIGLDKNLDLATASGFDGFYKQVEIAAKPNYTKENESTPIYKKGLDALLPFIKVVKDFSADKIPTIETELKAQKAQLPYIGGKTLANKDALKQAISDDLYLGLLNTSQIKDMKNLFSKNKNSNDFFDGIEYWNVANVENMSWMFAAASSFNQPLNEWNVANVANMDSMFFGASSFNQALNEWNVAKVTDMTVMFYNASSFNQPLNKWDVSNVTDMSYMFYGASSFNQPLNEWNVAKVTDMTGMFYNASSFNQPLNKWDVSNVTNMSYMFYGASSFNQPLNKWDVSNVTGMSYMFYGASSFNQPLNNWDVANVENMYGMFYNASSFNQPLNEWNVAKVERMEAMFSAASSFNQPLNEWNVGNVKNMEQMFFKASSFNQPLNNWNVVMVENMSAMFEDASTFDQDLSGWNVSNVTKYNDMFSNSAMQNKKGQHPNFK